MTKHPTLKALLSDAHNKQPERNKMRKALREIIARDDFYRKGHRRGERLLLSSNGTIGDYRKKGR